jgi:Ca2+/Na+ antiporter
MAGVLVHILIFSLSLLALAKGADYFVEYSARLAKRFGVFRSHDWTDRNFYWHLFT